MHSSAPSAAAAPAAPRVPMKEHGSIRSVASSVSSTPAVALAPPPVAEAGLVATSQGELPSAPNSTAGAGRASAAASVLVATSPRHSRMTQLRSLAVSPAQRSASITTSTACCTSWVIPQFITMSNIRFAGASSSRTAVSAVETIVVIASPHRPMPSPISLERLKCSVSRVSSSRSRSRMPTSSNQALSSHEQLRAGVSGRSQPAARLAPTLRNACRSSPSVCSTCSSSSPAKPWTVARCPASTSGATSTASTKDRTSSFTAVIMRPSPRR